MFMLMVSHVRMQDETVRAGVELGDAEPKQFGEARIQR